MFLKDINTKILNCNHGGVWLVSLVVFLWL